jgi:hypothetical protein
MEKKFKILPPSMPNFVRFEKKPSPKGEGIKMEEGFDIADFTEDEAFEYAELMRVTFIEHYNNRKKKK